MKNNRIYGAWYCVTILEIIISMQFVELSTLDIIFRVGVVIAGATCIYFGWVTVLKWLSTGILVLTCNGVMGMYDKIYREELAIKKSDMTLEMRSEPKLDLSSCKEFGNNWNCIKALKDAHKESVNEIRNENKLTLKNIQSLEIELPFIKIISVLLYAILAGVFSAAAIVAANVPLSPSRRQEVDVKVEPKKLSIEQVKNILAQKKEGVSDVKLAKLYEYQSRETFARHYKQAAQSFGLVDQKVTKEKFTVLRGRSA